MIGGRRKTTLRSAALANCTLVRYLDANDIYMPVAGSLSGSGHFSDALPALVSTAEAFDRSGGALIEAVVLAYEVQAALADSFSWLDLGFHSVSQVTIAVALAGGKLMGLTERQLAHAASLAITSGVFVQSWLRPSTSVPGLKGGAPGLAAERGITCAELASRSFTAPLDAFETFFEYFGDEISDPLPCYQRLGSIWMTSRNAIKPIPAQIYIQAVAECARSLYQDGLRLDRLANLTVRSNDGACGRVQGSIGAFRPLSREAADHSTPFVTAMVLRDGSVGPASYHGQLWKSGEVLEAMSRMELVIDERWTAQMNERGQFGAEIGAVDVEGRRYTARVDQFRGHPDNPLTQDDLVAKFETFVGGRKNAARLLNLCLDLEMEPGVERLIDGCAGEQATGTRGVG